MLSGRNVSLHGLRVADVGCGDGIMALGVAHRAKPAELVGFDVSVTDPEALLKRARAQEVVSALPKNLRFQQCEPTHLPAADASFDLVYTWSAFEHIEDPTAVLKEIKRILKPEGLLFLQLWPFYFSERGSHLWDWFPQPFHHLLSSDDEIELTMTSRAEPGDFMTGYMLGEFRGNSTGSHWASCRTRCSLRIRHREARLDQPRGRDRTRARAPVRLSDLGTAGVKLLTRPRPASVGREAAVPSEVSEL